ncbi:hypothetical protein EIP91_004134 [Steccherinum ochraceum]|uniref:Uncharacterized protein n=1 Tax=Steccherinum ochraceum TaxID=92696 RepID=A0A4V2MW02_9APHY|nr:hypothetical protein EIP91_004134 [Steccherinum ochraceum]
MGKLRMKRTPEEQARHDFKKAKKAARKAAKHEKIAPESKHSHPPRQEQWDPEYDEPEAGPSASRSHKPDYEAIQAEVEEARFRDKLWGALDDDERLDSVEARLNSFAHVPRRWRSGGMDTMEDDLNIDPQMMEDEMYAEWVRVGIWRKKHAAEHEEHLRKQQEQAARRAREAALAAETRRLERQAEEERKRKRREREVKRQSDARELYEMRWKELLAPVVEEGPARPLRFMDIPWPMFVQDLAVPASSSHFDLDAITANAITSFLLPGARFTQGSQDVNLKKERREKLRETLLRFHPDKFEGRILSRVEERDRIKTKEAVAKVAILLNTLMAAAD